MNSKAYKFGWWCGGILDWLGIRAGGIILGFALGWLVFS